MKFSAACANKLLGGRQCRPVGASNPQTRSLGVAIVPRAPGTLASCSGTSANVHPRRARHIRLAGICLVMMAVLTRLHIAGNL